MKTDSFVEFLGSRLRSEYQEILAPFHLEEYVDGLVSGKYMRSRIAYMLAGKASDELLQLCTALELLHTSSLVHDDIIDRASLRRGYPTLYIGAGADQALLIGNMLAVRAFRLAEATRRDVMSRFLDSYQRINQAQEMELLLRGDTNKTIEQCLSIYSGKTSAMIELPGWIAMSQSGELSHGLIRVLRDLGIAFQIIDDIEDVQEWLGKENGPRDKFAEYDIELGDFTLPILYAMDRVNTEERDWYKSVSIDIWKEVIEKSRSTAKQYILSAKDETQDREYPPSFLEWIEEWESKILSNGIEGFRIK